MVLKNKETLKDTVVYLKPDQLSDPKHYIDVETKAKLECVLQDPLTEWIAENYNKYGADLEFITNRSPEGFQFVQGFGGIGGMLRFLYFFKVESYYFLDIN